MVAFAEPGEFTADERSMLTNVARMLAQAIARTSMHETELQLSAGLQRTMRPATRPGIEGMELAARYVPTGGGLEVGGDWYDVIPLPSGRTALVIGDVQGHDVRAAGIMAQLRIALRAYAAEGHRPDAVLARASRFLAGMGRPEPLGGSTAPQRGSPATTASRPASTWRSTPSPAPSTSPAPVTRTRRCGCPTAPCSSGPPRAVCRWASSPARSIRRRGWCWSPGRRCWSARTG